METLDHTPEPSSRWAGLRTRVVSGAALAAVAGAALWAGGWVFSIFVIVGALIALREWDALTSTDHDGWKILGVLYVALPCACLVWLREVQYEDVNHAGAKLVLYLLLIICATDIGAYFTGRRIGGPKLAPSISPGKTWAGLAGGVAAAAFVGGFATFFVPFPPSFFAGLDLGIVLALLAQLGDLFESWLKRRAGVKDSGRLIPGHGGLLDRIDGLMFTAPLFAGLLYWSGSPL